MSNLFTDIQLPRQATNYFDLTHDVKMSGKMGTLMPCLAVEAFPGDKFNLTFESIIRMMPMVAPVMHRIDVSIHAFFVPWRLLWSNWEDWITGNQLVGGVDPVVPSTTFTAAGTNPGTLANYLGVPRMLNGNTEAVSALPFAAYQKIYDDYYRDENLVDLPKDYWKLTDGNNSNPDLFILRRRAWEHDYFTSALPFAQKGPAVEIPVASLEDAPVRWNLDNSAGTTLLKVNQGGGDTNVLIGSDTPNPSLPGDPPLYTDLSSSSIATSINDLRRAIKLQEWLERNARGGTRYVENILAHFGVRSSDARLQRAEYITGIKTPIIISEVLNSTGEDGGLPQGNMAGHGIGVSGGKAGSYYAEEHGIIIGVMSVMPKTAYQQGLPKMFSRTSRLDYPWPSFAHLGEQEIKNKELYVQANFPDNTFGYTPRYAEWKYMPSRVAGQMQTTLDYWHLGRIFANEPQLNEDFINCEPDTRIFAVTDPADDHLIIHVLNKMGASRKLPKFGTPSM